MRSKSLAAILAVVLLSQSAVAGLFNSERIYEGPDPANESRYFGYAGLELNGDRMLVMTYPDSITGAPMKVYLYNPVAGSLVADIAYPDPATRLLAQDLSDQWIALGDFGYSPLESYNRGRVLLYDAEYGGYVREILSPDPGKNFRFGQSVAVAGDRLLVGEPAYGQVVPGPSVAGRAHLFNADTGALLLTFNRPDTGTNGYDFGVSSVLLDDVAIIGDASNYVFLFDATNGNLLRTITAPAGVRFNNTLAAAGDLLAVSAGGYYSGPERVYVYRISTGELVNVFANPDEGIAIQISDSTDGFGGRIAISGNRLLVSAANWAPYPDDWPNLTTFPTQQHGRVYLFNALSGARLETLDSPITDFGSALSGAAFGGAVALEGTTAVVGAASILNGPNKFTNGRVYVYSDAFQVAMDIKPADPTNSIDIDSPGQLDVAVLTTLVSAGDATNFLTAYANAASLRIGPNQVAPIDPSGVSTDVDGDGDQDLLNQYQTGQLGLVCEQPEPVTLTGETVWGQRIWAVDEVTTNDCPSCHP